MKRGDKRGHAKKSDNDLAIMIIIILIMVVVASILGYLAYIYLENKPVEINETDRNITDTEIPSQNQTAPPTNQTTNESDDDDGGGGGGGGCTPNCAGKECGGDGCGGSCGSCGTGETCVSGKCVGCEDECDAEGLFCDGNIFYNCSETGECFERTNLTACGQGYMCVNGTGCSQVSCAGCYDCDNWFSDCGYYECKEGCDIEEECYFKGNFTAQENCIPLDEACNSISKCSNYTKEECENNPCSLSPGCALENGDCNEIIPPSCNGTDISCGVYPNCGNCNLLDGCYASQNRNYYCGGINCSYNADDCSDCSCSCGGYNKEESTTNGNCADGIDNDCDGKTDGYDENCEYGPKCGDGVCESGENCSRDAVNCTDRICYAPTCSNGCGEIFVEQGKNDEGCISPDVCNGNGNCIEPVYADIEVSVATLKYNYNVGEDIDITDPPDKLFTYERKLSPEEVESSAGFVEGEIIVKLKNTNLISTLNYSKINPGLDNRLSKVESEHSLVKKTPVFKELHEKLKSRDISPKEYNEEIEDSFSYMAHSDPSNITNFLPVYLMKINDGEDVLEKVKELSNDPDIEYAQPNYIMQAYYTPNDPYFSSSGSWGQAYSDLWGIKLIEADDAWDTTEGDGAIVAVIDTGISYTHEDLKDNMWKNPGEIPSNGRDDDSNGFIDDIYGYDFLNNDGNPIDDNGHGSHCAGTIAAVGNNGLGVIGVAPGVKLMAVKGLDKGGSGTTADLAEGVKYAVDNGARVLSNSWGSSSRMPSDAVIEEAVAYAVSKGVVPVFAAGNSNDDVAYYSPQNKETTITVAASTPGDEKCSFSNYGQLIDVSAPGGGLDNDPAGRGNVLSTLPEGVTLATSDRKVSNGYYRLAGTSMACPHVSGLAGLIISLSPSLSYEEVRDFIRGFADDIGEPGKDTYFGYGRINALWAVRGVMGDVKINLTSPSKGSYLKGTVNLIGTISSENYFGRYEIYYADEKDLNNLILLKSSTTPVEDGLLATWDTTKTTDGKKMIILRIITNDGKSLQKSFEVSVDNINEPPSFEDAPNVRIAVIGSLLQFKLVAHDPDDPSSDWGKLTYSVENLPSGAAYNVNTNMFSWTPSMADKGSYSVTFRASDSYFTTKFDLLLSTLYVDKRKVTNDAVSQTFPSIYENKIVWKENGIYLYDLVSQQKTKISSLSTGTLPKIHGSMVVWADGENIYSYNLLTGQENLRVSEEWGFDEIEELDIYGNYFVYQKPTFDEIFSYNLQTGVQRRYSDSIFSGAPSVYQDFLTFHDWGTETGIYGYNLTTFRGDLILQTEFGQADPKEPDVHENQLVYLGSSSFSSDIRVMNLLDKNQSFVNSDTTNNKDPKISGKSIVWTNLNSGGLFEEPIGDVYVYDLNMQEKIKLTNSKKARDHDIYGNRIVYADQNSGDSSYEIYIADLYYAPIIFYVEPSLVPTGGIFNIIGDNFGYIQGNSEVVFENGVKPEIIAWGNDKITCKAPSSPLPSGKLRVITEAGPSNWVIIGIGKVESYIKNNENFPITGNLKLILQKKSGNSWIDEKIVVNQQVTVPANNRIKLDSYWNSKPVSALSDGDYRVYAEFEYRGIKYSEEWYIEVSGVMVSKSLFSRLLDWLHSLLI